MIPAWLGSFAMRGMKYDRILAGTALALVLSVTGYPVIAAPVTQAEIEAAVPLPDLPNLPPPSLADVVPTTTATVPIPATEPAPSKTKAALPEPVATPSFMDVPMPAAPAATDVTTPAAPAATDVAVPATIPAEETKPTIATNLTPVDVPIAEKLRDLVNAKLTRFFDRKTERSAVEQFYRGRQFAPLWIENGMGNARAKAAIAQLRAAERDGLDSADYPTPDFKAGAEPEALATAELKLLASALTYARHAQVGRVHYSRIAADIYYNQVTPEPAEILADIALADDVGHTLDGYNPPHAEYKALKAKLAEIRTGKGESGAVRIASG